MRFSCEGVRLASLSLRLYTENVGRPSSGGEQRGGSSFVAATPLELFDLLQNLRLPFGLLDLVLVGAGSVACP